MGCVLGANGLVTCDACSRVCVTSPDWTLKLIATSSEFFFPEKDIFIIFEKKEECLFLMAKYCILRHFLKTCRKNRFDRKYRKYPLGLSTLKGT